MRRTDQRIAEFERCGRLATLSEKLPPHWMILAGDQAFVDEAVAAGAVQVEQLRIAQSAPYSRDDDGVDLVESVAAES